ncbi:MAG: hypothetical protein HFJ49_02365 [Clostridia bacterium]|nr:hypothetical protein [Clostridia bacterium]
MIVINKKRITAILTCILVGVFVFILETSDKGKDVIETVTLPVSGKTVVIDAGHGIPDERSRKFKRYNRSTN